MRLAAYAGASTALAAGVIVYAFNQRPNFYSACVYLAQSNLCLMILTNLILFAITSFIFGLQRLFYGPLRPIEIEQLYEKAWFAVTETCLAMTIFREEVGAWFLVMFVALLAGKVWGWIGEGRVEILEQQPPANPRLFHIRLAISLLLSLGYDMWFLAYTINTVIEQARPNMMVMFLFEFAILTSASCSTALRYVISLVDIHITKKQTQERLEQRRREVREEREEIIRQRAAAAAASEAMSTNEATPELPVLPSEDDVDEMDIEVPGWEGKGQWILSLDLVTDLVKLLIYLTFFCILLAFYGLPIHILRDLFLTTRSFIKRLDAFIRYRKATHDMNQRYPDATVEEIQREDTCIICREEMTPWSVTNPPQQPVAGVNEAGHPPTITPRPTRAVNERSRPKKLPCGHVLHLGCLKSWLERQQVCPTCRRPVVDSTPPAATRPQPGQAVPAAAQIPGQPQIPGVGGDPHPQDHRQNQNRRIRMINFGPIRFGFGQIPQDAIQQFGVPRLQPPQPDTAAHATQANSIQEELERLEQQIVNEIRGLQVSQHELQIVQLLQAQLVRLRAMHGAGTPPPGGNAVSQIPTHATLSPSANRVSVPSMQRLAAQPGVAAIPSGHTNLPPGVIIPEGWTLLPLQRINEPAPIVTSSAGNGINTVLPQPAGLQTSPMGVLPTQAGSSDEHTRDVPPSMTQGPAATTASSQAIYLEPTPTIAMPMQEPILEPASDNLASNTTTETQDHNNLTGIQDPVATFSDIPDTIPSQAPIPDSTVARIDSQPQSSSSAHVPLRESAGAWPPALDPPSTLAFPTSNDYNQATGVNNSSSSGTIDGGTDSVRQPSEVANDDYPPEHDDYAGGRQKDKGKAKVTTIEDVSDEDA